MCVRRAVQRVIIGAIPGALLGTILGDIRGVLIGTPMGLIRLRGGPCTVMLPARLPRWPIGVAGGSIAWSTTIYGVATPFGVVRLLRRCCCVRYVPLSLPLRVDIAPGCRTHAPPHVVCLHMSPWPLWRAFGYAPFVRWSIRVFIGAPCPGNPAWFVAHPHCVGVSGVRGSVRV